MSDTGIDRAEVRIEQLFPEQHQRNAAGKTGNVKKHAIDHEAAGFLIEQQGQGEPPHNRKRQAQHHVNGVSQVNPEEIIVPKVAKVFQPREMEADGVLQIPIREAGNQ